VARHSDSDARAHDGRPFLKEQRVSSMIGPQPTPADGAADASALEAALIRDRPDRCISATISARSSIAFACRISAAT
jgi:hypothetical protein